MTTNQLIKDDQNGILGHVVRWFLKENGFNWHKVVYFWQINCDNLSCRGCSVNFIILKFDSIMQVPSQYGIVMSKISATSRPNKNERHKQLEERLKKNPSKWTKYLK